MISDAPQPGALALLESFCKRLAATDWRQPNGPLRLNADLKLIDLANAGFFINTRIFLNALAEAEGAPATATGRLNRVFVQQMFERLKLDSDFRDSIRTVCKVVNEQDLWPLHLVRIISEIAGLVARRKKHFILTKTGRAMLPDNQAGALFQRLFIAYFQRFDLHYDFHCRNVPGIQQTLGIILWRLEVVARHWKAVRGLASEILTPGVHAQLRQAMLSSYDTEEWILGGYVLEPLSDFGLIERQKHSERRIIAEKDFIQITPLWRKFIRFVL
ncbi:MAG TPA: hypothetical protein VFC07_16145 [Verrucomicrobiae bacterium]|nr:hypothetical protein [Verrucomicrobiae bacterium]